MSDRFAARSNGMRPRGTGHDAELRGVAVRLAAQTVALLLVMLVVVEASVYIITRHSLQQSIQDGLQQRVNPDAHFISDLFGHRNIPGVPQDGGGPGSGGDAFLNPPHSDASTVYLDANMQILRSGGPLGNTVVDATAAKSALLAGKDLCCPIRTSDGQDYFVDTALLRYDGQIVGVAQSTVSAHQYENTLDTLRLTLLLVAVLGLLTSGVVSAVLVRRSLVPIRFAMQRQRNFVADAAHELRTPLAIMRTVGEVGMNEVSSDERQATIEKMLMENTHLTRLVDDLSLLARADTSAISIDHSPVDLASLVTDMTAEISPLAEEQGVILTSKTAGSVRVSGDLMRLRQLLLILLDNALKHTPKGGSVTIDVSPRGGRAGIQVADTGPGIDPVDLPRIFDRFYRADKARTSEGSGLGLSIGRWIVDAHGGNIQAGNAPAGGAVFTVTLPISRAPVA